MTSNVDKLNSLWARGTELLGTEYAILGGAMSWVSDRHLVSAISNAGGFGVIACGGMTPDLLKAEIEATAEMTDKPFGVNLITLHPDLDALIDICKELKVTHVVLAGGLPTGPSIEKIKSFGAKLMCFAPTAVIAKKLVRSGVDAIIIEGSEAGGHIGPVSTSVLAQEILPVVDKVPVFIAGGIGRGEAISSYLEMGASGAQLGTRFVVAEECQAHENFKKAFIRASARDSVASVQIDQRFPVIPVRALKNAATEDFMKTQQEVINRYHDGGIALDDGQMEIEKYWAGALKQAVIDGDVEHGSVMAGQSVGMVKKVQPMQEIMDELVEQARDYLA
ncbi:nitronate monooxygenase [Temperatibacter marinus]|uniref:Nitronate monooxygenase n=1 Tax=Temperatibacter marinus TaxID=1456591 RepID=A0AA52EEK5_9PROT|nr:nitronate monooxygenase [Temperatibacter marinus]WND01375.1 nitronate monooxygenase [Temperatibacter marinus]